MSLASAATEFERFTGYAYYQLRLFDTLRLTAGATYDQIRFPSGIVQPPIATTEESRERLSPKLGADWTPWARTRFRAAYTRSVAGLFNDSTTLIEPDEVAGFNQSFRSLTPLATVAGTTFETTAVGFDHEFSTRTYLAAEAGLRNSQSDQLVGMVQGFLAPGALASDKQAIDFKEKYIALNLNQLAGPDLSFGAGYTLSSAAIAYDNQILGQPAGTTGTQYKINNQATLHQVSLFGNYYLPCGFFSQVQANWYAQSDKGFAVNEPGDNFWQFNLFAGYRFPKRHIEIQVGRAESGQPELPPGSPDLLSGSRPRAHLLLEPEIQFLIPAARLAPPFPKCPTRKTAQVLASAPFGESSRGKKAKGALLGHVAFRRHRILPHLDCHRGQSWSTGATTMPFAFKPVITQTDVVMVYLDDAFAR